MANLETIGALSLSVISTVAIVVCNKYLLSVAHFQFATTLSGWHLLTTFLGLHVARWMKLFEYKRSSLTVVLTFGFVNAAAVGLLNLCLGFNSVGFYQMTKLAIIPCTALLQRIFQGIRLSFNVQMSLLVLLLGVGYATISDITFNWLGATISIFTVLATSVTQIMISSLQRTQGLTSTQLLYAAGPCQALTLIILGPPVDQLLTGQSVLKFNYTYLTLALIFASCAIAVSVNFSNFLAIGKTSPISFQVLGHLKTCLIIMMGYVVFDDKFQWKNISGVAVALVGMVAYSYFQTRISLQVGGHPTPQRKSLV